ncbi:MAG TPA: hypothetical protein VH877_32995 [Polyangia bacterium]|jgi:hypothetical protein|nr:hypothetical protein [Polyangia bacterium]
MLDLHQGFTGDELKDVPPTIGSLALSQIEVAATLARGQVRRAARQQVGALRLAGELMRNAIKGRLGR